MCATDGCSDCPFSSHRGMQAPPEVTQAGCTQSEMARRMKARVRVTTRGMWTDQGQMLEHLHRATESAVSRLPVEATLTAVERSVCDALRRAARSYNGR